jgi:uncharacterized OsmC-like protein
MIVRHDSGERFTATCGDYTVVSGQGADGDGTRDGMWPAQLFVASIGMCIAGYVASYCRHHDLPYHDIVVELDRETVRRPSRTTSIEARVKVPMNLSEKDARAMALVADRCHITQSIVEGMAIRVSVEAEPQT